MVLDSSNLHKLLGRLVQRNFGHSGLGSRLDMGAWGTMGSQRTQEVKVRQSQAYPLGPLDVLHKCCV